MLSSVASPRTTIAMLLAASLALAACGGGGKNETVATVGQRTKVTRATLDHWMEVTLGSGYQGLFHAHFPAGLISDPPDYARCARAAEGIPRTPGRPKLTDDQRRVRCRQLYAALEEQALNFVISSLWTREEARELGIPMPGGRELGARLRAYIDNDFKSSANFRNVIAAQHRSLSDVRFMVETTLLQGSIEARLRARAGHLSANSQAAFYRLVVQNRTKWQAKTSCNRGYRASQCKQYGPGSELKPAANQVLEYFRKGIA